MKLQPDKPDVQTVTAHGPGWVAVNGERIAHSVVVGSREERFDWPCTRFEELGPEHFAQLAALGAEVVIFGSGDRIRFPRPAWIAPLVAQRTGVETMDTAAACRTYNVLLAEGRSVVAALLFEA
jgi:uncharacterized protein